MDILSLIGRNRTFLDEDVKSEDELLKSLVRESRFLVIGGAGTIGQAVTKEIFKRQPRLLHVVDISENDMVELVRDVRSKQGYIDGDFRTFAVDCGALEFDALVSELGPYDYVFNLSALKHVRSEKDQFTLMRLIETNIVNVIRALRLCRAGGAMKYFCVSTDKAANPVNMMGASKRIMEMFLMRESLDQSVSMARFANVAFSNGSLLHGFNQRILKHQPISAPTDVRRYFVTPEEAGLLCLMAGLLGNNREIFFPKLDEDRHQLSFSEIAVRYLRDLGYEPYECVSEDEARERARELILTKRWPCYFSASNTTGEKDFEEFYVSGEDVNLNRYKGIGVIRNTPDFDGSKLDTFEATLDDLRGRGRWSKGDLVALFKDLLPEFAHKELGRHLDERM